MNLAIIGAGKAGRSLAAEAIRAGHRVVLEDVLPSKLRTALEEIATAGQPVQLEFASTVEDAVRDADLVIDFVPDELESKLEIISMVDRMAPPRTILCILTTALSVNDLASCTYRTDRCIGMRMQDKLTKLVRGAKTSEATARTTAGFWQSLGYAAEFEADASPQP